MDETTVEVRESKEGLDVLYFPRFQPIGDGLNFLCRHGESIGVRIGSSDELQQKQKKVEDRTLA